MQNDIMSTQQLFDKAVQGVLVQGERSVDENSSCCYRVEKNGCSLKCAIGMLITDGCYETGMEGHGIHNERVESGVAASIGRDLTLGEARLLRRLQEGHDSIVQNVLFNTEFLALAEATARIHGLQCNFDVDGERTDIISKEDVASKEDNTPPKEQNICHYLNIL